jgi:hypothetical protein
MEAAASAWGLTLEDDGALHEPISQEPGTGFDPTDSPMLRVLAPALAPGGLVACHGGHRHPGPRRGTLVRKEQHAAVRLRLPVLLRWL